MLKPKKIYFTKKKGKELLGIEFENGTRWIPKIGEIGLILRAMSESEDINYPNGEGKGYLFKYIYDLFHSRFTMDELKRKYKL